jgi:phosphopantothenoylcysteine synthetase/decarboxylase
MPRFLVTAGNTRERIDSVRDWGNIFTGNTGRRIAEALAAAGGVHLLTSNAAHARELAGHPCVTVELFTDHADLRRRLGGHMSGGGTYDAVFMTAAVSDYTPARTFVVVSREVGADGTETWKVRDAQASKVKSHYDQIAVLGARTEKLIDLFRTEWAYRGVLVKFKLEVGPTDEELLRIARHSRAASDADLIVANTLEMVQGDKPGAYLVGRESEEWVARDALAETLRERVLTLIAAKSS